MERHLQSRLKKGQNQDALDHARQALEHWRMDEDSSDFPCLRFYLFRRSRGFSLIVDGVDLKLTQMEYEEMKKDYLASEEGKEDKWLIEPW